LHALLIIHVQALLVMLLEHQQQVLLACLMEDCATVQKPENRHELDRKLVREVVCALCGDRQPLARHCRSCQVWCKHCHAFTSYADARCCVTACACNAGKGHSGGTSVAAAQVSFGAYGCLRCAFFEDETAARKQFHCEQCGLCRIGGRASFFHCDTCGCCYTVSLKVWHHVRAPSRGC